MKWDTTRALVGFAITSFCASSAALASCSSDGITTNDTDATYGSAFQDGPTPIEATAPTPCLPALPDAWTPPAFVPPVRNNKACTPEQVQDYDQGCFSATGSSAACDSFLSAGANATCATCLLSQYVDSPRGATYVLPDDLYRANYPGCIALVDGDFSEKGCAAAMQALIECEDTSCLDTCPIDTSSSDAENASILALAACEKQADRNLCQSEYAAAGCTVGRYPQCQFNDFEAEVVGVSNFMCASGNLDDAGLTDAGDTE